MHVRTSYSLAGCLAAVALATSLAANAGPNIVQNGGFESGDFPPGWTLIADPLDVTLGLVGVDTLAPHSGTYAAYFGNFNAPATISQTLATSPGDFYTVSFWLQSEDIGQGTTPSSFSFTWDGLPALLTLTDPPASPYTNYSFIVKATAAATTISFTAENTQSFFDLDDVSAIPEPGSLALVALGGSLLGFARRRRGG